MSAPARGPRRASPSDALAPALALVAEGAWISVPAAFVQATVREPAWLGPAGFAALAAIGWLFARRLAGRGWVGPLAAPVLVVGGCLAGWLASADVRGLLLAGDPGTAVIRHPGGWLGGLAVLRGIAHARPWTSEESLGRLVAIATPVLAIPVLVGGVIPEPGRQAFLDQATVAVVAFVLAATLGLAIGRMTQVASAAGFDWRRNRAWLLLLAVLVGTVALGAVPSSPAVGRAIQVLLTLLFVPILVLATLASVTRVTRRTLLVLGIILVVGVLVVVVAPNRGGITAGPPAPLVPGDETADNTTLYVAFGLLLLAGLAGVIVLIVRMWMREAVGDGDEDVREERVIDRPARLERSGLRLPRLPGPGPRREAPASAVAAYRALLRALEPDPELRRARDETPAAHAARLRAAGDGALGLELLAADYELDRWGARRLSAGEEGRAIERWRRLRRDLPRAAALRREREAGEHERRERAVEAADEARAARAEWAAARPASPLEPRPLRTLGWPFGRGRRGASGTPASSASRATRGRDGEARADGDADGGRR